jgi:TRAP-type C4-dicarboxylate transport system substrate-binding protein
MKGQMWDLAKIKPLEMLKGVKLRVQNYSLFLQVFTAENPGIR